MGDTSRQTTVGVPGGQELDATAGGVADGGLGGGTAAAGTSRPTGGAGVGFAGSGGRRVTVESPFPGCFGCGFDREGGLRVTLGRTDGDTFAGVWTPPAVSGELPARYVWAALHCPAGLVFLEGGGRAVLERVTLARYRAPVSGQPNVVVAVSAGANRGRRLSAAALYTSTGELVAHSAGAWIVG